MIYATHLFAMFSLISAVLYWYFKLNQLDQSIRIHFSISIRICLVILGILIAIWLTLWSSYQFKQQLPHFFSPSLSLLAILLCMLNCIWHTQIESVCSVYPVVAPCCCFLPSPPLVCGAL